VAGDADPELTARPSSQRGSIVRFAPWDYIWRPFNPHLFPDLFTPTWVASLVLLIALVVIYNVRTKALHRHAPFLDMYEWLLWTGLTFLGLVLTASLFAFDLVIILIIEVIGLATLIWVRFVRFPPMLDAYEHRLAKQRYFTKTKFARPEATIRPKAARRARRRR
jgi:hypothetical protein